MEVRGPPFRHFRVEVTAPSPNGHRISSSEPVMRTDRLSCPILALCLLSACGADDAVDSTGEAAGGGDPSASRDASPVQSGDLGVAPGAAPRVVINEVILGDVPGDRVELLNLGPTDVDLGGYFVTDDPAGKPDKAALPPGTVVPAGDRLVLTLTETTVGFGLGGDEAFGLFTPEGALVDQTDWAADQAPEGGAWGRLPDGTGAFQTLATATPGAPNMAGQSVDAGVPEVDAAAEPADAALPPDLGPPAPTTPVVVNEVAADGPMGDWVELHNPSGADADVSGFFLTDDPLSKPMAYALPAGTVVPAGGYLVVNVSAATTGFGLGSDEALALLAPGGAVVDQADWAEGEAPAGSTYGRLPDGSGPFATLPTPTPGAVNTDAVPPPCPFDCAPETGLVINEVVAAGEPADAVEFYNGNNLDADLGGYFVSDDPDGAPDRAELPAGTVVPARGYLVLDISDDTVGFRLAAAEAFSLADPQGVIVDETRWADGDSPVDGAWARRPNGVGAFHSTDAATLGMPNAP